MKVNIRTEGPGYVVLESQSRAFVRTSLPGRYDVFSVFSAQILPRHTIKPYVKS